MRKGQLLFSAFHFFLCVFLLGLGVVIFFLPSLPELQFNLTELLHNDQMVRVVGFGIFFMSFLFFWGLGKASQIRFYEVSMQSKALEVVVDSTIIRSYVQTYWTDHFKGEVELQDLAIRKDGSWEIVARFSSADLKRQEHILQSTEEELGKIFAENFGYTRPFIVTATFSV